ncbi:MAG: DUF5053 domain-containing protein [Bacteroidales bacterium]|nr:DUF5053 domain-containing protein [Bacteroidales bacterium]
MGTTVKKQLQPLLSVISWAEVSRTYFGKSNSWLYHKLNGIDGNGKPTSFNDEERARLKEALQDLSARIAASANAL